MVVYAICPGGVCPPGTDPDRDGLETDEELEIYHTDPRIADTDRDALGDGREVSVRTNPLVPDTDREGLLDGKEVNG